MKPRIGRQEPTKHIVLPYVDTGGKDAMDLYEMTGRAGYEWQKTLINDILARNEDGSWTHTRYGYSVPRQNGKGEILAIRELYALASSERVIHTAHLVQTAHKAFERLCIMLDDLGLPYRSIKAKGQELIEITDGGRIEFRTRTATGALGESYDVLIVDEAQEYKIDQESALTYVISASQNPQTIMCGTPPTPVSSGTVFRDYRDNMLMGELGDCGWAEWSVDEMSDVNDKDLWYETNPSLGIRIKERTVASEIGTTEDKTIDFNIQRLGLWIRQNQKSAILATDWEKTLVNSVPKFHGFMDVGIKYDKGGDTVSVAIAVKTTDDRIFIEIVNRLKVRDGINWIISFLKKSKPKLNKVVIDGASGQQILADAMKAEKIKGCVFPTVKQVVNAYALFEKNIYESKLCRMDQPALTAVVTNCEKRRIGSGGGFGYQAMYAEMDNSLLDAAVLASWAIEEFPDPRQQKIYY